MGNYKAAGVILLAAIFSGCATIINGDSQTVTIETVPAGAYCTVGGQTIQSPAEVRLLRETNYPVTCTMAGFDPAYGTIAGRLSGWTFLDAPAIIPLAVDFDGGSAFNLSPSRLVLTLQPRSGAPALPGQR